MKRIDKPVKKVADILEILKNDTTRLSVVLDMDSTVEVLTDREELYQKKVENAALFEILRDNIISSRVDKDKIISYYNYRIVEKSKGRAFYDEVFLSAPKNICPYCGINTVKTIDHFLPKSEYPSYSITPINLVPCCRDCNLDKKVVYPTSSNDQTFHPYFDEIDNECWIRAELMQTEPLSFQYNVIRPVYWSDTKFNRANAHFNSYNINQLFSNAADREITGMQHILKKLHSMDANLLRVHLEEIYNSCLNSLGLIDWKTLMYKELSTNKWFLEGCTGINFFK